MVIPAEHAARAEWLIAVDDFHEGPTAGNIALAHVHAILATLPAAYLRATSEQGFPMWQHQPCSRIKTGDRGEAPPLVCGSCRGPGVWLPLYTPSTPPEGAR